ARSVAEVQHDGLRRGRARVYARKLGGDVLVRQAVEAVSLHAGVVELFGQRESLGHVGIRSVERRVEAGDLCELRRALQQLGNGRHVVRLMQRRERNEARERLERLRLDPDWTGELESPVDDPVSDADQPMIRKVVLEEVSQILDRAVVTERRSTP